MWGRSKIDPASDTYVDNFYETTPVNPEWGLEKKLQSIRDFISRQQVRYCCAGTLQHADNGGQG
jgi:hypothetical protein